MPENNDTIVFFTTALHNMQLFRTGFHDMPLCFGEINGEITPVYGVACKNSCSHQNTFAFAFGHIQCVKMK